MLVATHISNYAIWVLLSCTMQMMTINSTALAGTENSKQAITVRTKYYHNCWSILSPCIEAHLEAYV